MKTKENITTNSWPRHLVTSVDTRKNDLVIRITDWTRDKDEPAYDVEIYNAGVYDWNESKSFTTRSSGRTKKQARSEAISFAQFKIQTLLK